MKLSQFLVVGVQNEVTLDFSVKGLLTSHLAGGREDLKQTDMAGARAKVGEQRRLPWLLTGSPSPPAPCDNLEASCSTQVQRRVDCTRAFPEADKSTFLTSADACQADGVAVFEEHPLLSIS